MKKLITISSIIFFLISCSKTENLGIFGESRNKYILGQDGVTSVPVSKTIYLWTFGDTIIGSRKKKAAQSATFEESSNISSMISNSLAFSRAPTCQNIENLDFVFHRDNGKIAQFIKFNKNESPETTRLWPLDGTRIGNRIFVYYLIIKNDRKNVPFYLKNVGLAMWQVPERWIIGNSINFIRLKNLFSPDFPAFGAGLLKHEGHIYLTGHYAAEDGTSPIKIARVKISSIEKGNLYEFLKKDGSWTTRINSAGAFLGDVMGECSLSFNEYLKKYVIIYCQAWSGNIIMVKFSDFSELENASRTIIYRPAELPRQKSAAAKYYYSGKEIFSDDDSIFIIYINPMDFQPYLLKMNIGCNFDRYFY